MENCPHPTGDRIVYFYTIHSNQLFIVILEPFDTIQFIQGFTDTKRYHDLQKICYVDFKIIYEPLFLPSSICDSE